MWTTLVHLPTRFSDFVNSPIGLISLAEGLVFVSALLVRDVADDVGAASRSGGVEAGQSG